MSKQDSNWEPIGIRWGLVSGVFYSISPKASHSDLSHYMTEKPSADEVFEAPPVDGAIPQIPDSSLDMPPPLPTQTPRKRVRIR
jgi:hypothetical protein